MIRFSCACPVLFLAVASVLGAQSSAEKQAASWFGGVGADPIARLNRLSALSDKDLDVWVAAGRKVGLGGTRADFGFQLMKFNPLFDSKGQKLSAAVAKYTGRLEQLPKTAIDQWRSLTQGDSLPAAISLTAEDAVFPREKFSAEAFRQFAAKFK